MIDDAMSLIFSCLFLFLCFVIIIYSKTAHYKNHFSPEAQQKKRDAKLGELIKAANRKRDLSVQSRINEKAASKIALAVETETAVNQIKELALPAAIGNLSRERPHAPETSHVGGPVYLPQNISYPLDTDGNPMLFIIQINFAEIPNIPGYPKEGVFQLFVQADEMLGINSAEHGTRNRQVFFWKNTEKLKSRHDPIKVHPDILLYKRDWIDGKTDTTTARDIHQNGRKIEFKSSLSDVIPWLVYDYPVPKILGQEFKKHVFLDEHVQEAIDGINPEAQIMIGGYSSNGQIDPRFQVSEDTEHTRVLLTIRSMDEIQVWDNYNLNIFVRPMDLKHQDFSNIIYYID